MIFACEKREYNFWGVIIYGDTGSYISNRMECTNKQTRKQGTNFTSLTSETEPLKVPNDK